VTDWIVIVPVKGTSDAKSRLGAGTARRAALARAIALDTVEAAVGSAGVSQVVVVTGPDLAPALSGLGAVIVPDPEGGLIAAITSALAVASALDADAATAVLLGDLPGLQPAELSLALAAASRHPRAMVADAEGLGTVLITATSGQAHAPSFGSGSRAAHAALGYRELTGQWPGLRRDVDTAADLEAVRSGGRLGRRTQEALGA